MAMTEAALREVISCILGDLSLSDEELRLLARLDKELAKKRHLMPTQVYCMLLGAMALYTLIQEEKLVI